MIEAADGGSDTVWTYVDYTLGADVENMRIVRGTHFVGNDGNNSIFNISANAVTIDGGAGDDVLWSSNGREHADRRGRR